MDINQIHNSRGALQLSFFLFFSFIQLTQIYPMEQKKAQSACAEFLKRKGVN